MQFVIRLKLIKLDAQSLIIPIMLVLPANNVAKLVSDIKK